MRCKSLASKGFSLIELLVVIAIAAIPAMAVGILLMASARSWNQIYARVHSEIQQDSMAVMTSVQTYGRKANQSNYRIYKINQDVFTEAVSEGGSQVAKGQALELRYWKEPFNPQSADSSMLEFTNTGTHYALYYLDGDELKVDFGQVVDDVGGVQNGSRQTNHLLATQLLAGNVDTSKSADIFSHTITGGRGSGCVNTTLKLTADTTKGSVEVVMATLLRSTWPQ